MQHQTRGHKTVDSLQYFHVLVNEFSNIITTGIAEIADDGKPFTTASYANGPGYVKHRVNNNDELEPRMNLSDVDTCKFSVEISK